MSDTVIQISEKTRKNFSLDKLEKFVNSEDFEDIVLGFQMLKGETKKRSSYSNFKKEIGL